MSGYLQRNDMKTISLNASHLDRLISEGNSDAALLYMALMRASGAISPEELQKKWKWTELRLDSAEKALQDLGIIERPQTQQNSGTDEPINYTREELADLIATDVSFTMLVQQMDAKLGKHLTTGDLQWIANLYNDQYLPVDVIYLLLSHCIAECHRRYGEGRMPTARAIWKEGCYWAQRGICDQESAAKFLKEHEEKRNKTVQYMEVLGLGKRRPVQSEEKFILGWIEKGFTPDVVALAYDQTIYYKHELNWNYLNGILNRWDKDGKHSIEEVQAGKRPKNDVTTNRTSTTGTNAWMSSYTKKKR